MHLEMYSEKWFYVYIMTNRSMNFYIGVSNNIRERTFQHKTGAFEGFTSRYKLDRLVYWEKYKYVNAALAREKQLKRWRSVKKMQLIVSMNPTWEDLAADWFPDLHNKSNA